MCGLNGLVCALNGFDGNKLVILLDADNGILEVQIEDLESRPSVSVDLSDNQYGLGRELFNIFRENVGPTSEGANSVL